MKKLLKIFNPFFHKCSGIIGVALYCTCFIYSIPLTAQERVKQIVPLSPNAAAITQYGETPVDKFTGVPAISVPLFEIGTKNFSIPIGLNYNASGNKVETIASNVGLGWSINTIPVISRSVNGLPDNGPGGFFSKFLGYSVFDLYHRLNGVTNSQYNHFLTLVKSGEMDSEPDFFFISLVGFSGKFVFDQVNNKFITIPSSNIKIEFSNDVFYVTDDKGINYRFDVNEKTQSNTSEPGENIISAWYPSEMYKFNNENKVSFQYRNESQITKSIRTYTKYQFISGNISGGSPSDEGSVQIITQISAKIISQINFPGGYAKFVPTSTTRTDLNGGYAIDKIELYNKLNVKVRSFDLQFTYFTGSGCAVDNPYSKYWLKLDKVIDENTPNREYEFLYETTKTPPCRNSTAQDFWGYYNGKTSNPNLIPTQWLENISPPFQYISANRTIHESSSQFGIIKRMTYPTGGYTDFVFENHVVNDDQLPGQYTQMISSIEESAPPMEDYYEEFFTISNPPDEFLNDNDPNGGSFVTVGVGSMVCEGSPQCGLLYLRGLSSTNNSINITFTQGFNYYLPNGDYKMSVQFNQDPPQTNGFYYQIIWNVLEGGQIPGNNLAGGLRLKSQRLYEKPGVFPITREYIYKANETDTESSGLRLNQSPLDYSEMIKYRKLIDSTVQPGLVYIYTADYQQMRAYSNTPQVTSSFGSVGYSTIIEKFVGSTNSESIKSEFSIIPTVPLNYFPYPPVDFESGINGKKIYEEVNSVSGYSNTPLKKSEFKYIEESNISDITFGIKIGDKLLSNRPEMLPTPQIIEFYELTSNVGLLSEKSEWESSANNANYFERKSKYYYDDYRNLYKLSQTGSKSDSLHHFYFYPYNVSYTGQEESARQLMITNNELGTVVKEQSKIGSTLFSERETKYKPYFSGVYLPSSDIVKRSSSDPGKTTDYMAYDSRENIQEVRQSGDRRTEFIWALGENLLLAEIQNSSLNKSCFSSFEYSDNKGGWTYSGTPVTTFKTGTKGYNLSSGSISKTGITASSSSPYRVGFWAKTVSGTGSVNVGGQTESLTTAWKWVEKTITSTSLTISGSNIIIDELRLHPADAMMTSYTYEPLVGMTSQTDPRGYTVNYFYDTANRLQTIKDEDGNILEHYEYNYAGN
ncbi:RHS repeat domain-containing protein [Algoriphagus sp. Y33]|uniref:RHS repeat domain-containing protein n=1 Tax=Algoriphagus sp. Y33 TaxID=2772483 RepID=UPI00177CED08|nr:RHS repeat domain-containing protein [Algoriphagus sp. Y33]